MNYQPGENVIADGSRLLAKFVLQVVELPLAPTEDRIWILVEDADSPICSVIVFPTVPNLVNLF